MYFALLLVFLSAAFPALYFLQNSTFDHSKRIRAYGQTTFYLPPKKALKIFSLGFDQVISDFFWIKALTYKEHSLVSRTLAAAGDALGARDLAERERRRVFDLLEMATFFDHRFVYAYEFGGAIFSWEGDVERANAILSRGLKNNPDAWRLAYLIGFNHYFFRRDFEEAMRYFKMASEIPGSLVRGSFVAQLYLMMNEPDTALKILYSFYESAGDPDSKKFYAERIKYLVVEMHLRRLNEAVEKYEEKFGNPCEDVLELVREGIIDGIPAEPFGGEYVIDFADHRAVNRPYNRYAPVARFMDVKKQIKDYRPKYEP